MAEVSFEAWQGQSKPIDIAAQVFQSTTTNINFSVIDSDRNAVNLTGYAIQFLAKKVDTAATLFTKTCSIVNAAGGTCKAALSVSDLATAGECLGELKLFSGGDVGGDCTDRIQFRFSIVEVIA